MTTRMKVRTPLAYTDAAEVPCRICCEPSDDTHTCNPDAVHQQAVMLLDYEAELRAAARTRPAWLPSPSINGPGRIAVNPNA